MKKQQLAAENAVLREHIEVVEALYERAEAQGEWAEARLAEALKREKGGDTREADSHPVRQPLRETEGASEQSGAPSPQPEKVWTICLRCFTVVRAGGCLCPGRNQVPNPIEVVPLSRATEAEIDSTT